MSRPLKIVHSASHTSEIIPATLLAEETRGQWVENRHAGWIIQVDLQGKILAQTQYASQCHTFFRSAAKPFQAIPLLRAELACELGSSGLAIACASHTGTAQHLAEVRRLLRLASLSESLLGCGPHAPFDSDAAYQLIQSQKSPKPIHNNCSGKHAAMLLCCQKHGWSLGNYLQVEHPLQQQIQQEIQQFACLENPPPSAIDGCGAPIVYLSLFSMAFLYAKLVSDPFLQPILKAMTAHPTLIGGFNRVDSLIMQVSQGNLLAKVGADGVLAIGNASLSQGLLIKMADGNNTIRDQVALETLRVLGWLNASELADSRLQPFLDGSRINTRQEVVGDCRLHVATSLSSGPL
ncbi:MAG: asparaginase [Candidatus Melainabacteria bacterium]|nr:asparaginase [Candidatus Melainabacteria bacterium]